MSLRLCAVCRAVLTGPKYLRQERPHHQSTDAVLQAAAQGCYVCGVITKSGGWRTLAEAGNPFRGTWYLTKPANLPFDWLKLTIDAIPDEEEDGKDAVEDEEDEEDEADETGPTLGAPGFALPKPPLWGFLLQPVQAVKDNVGYHVPPTGGLESPGFLELPLQWFAECSANHARCPRKPSFYPSRLLDITNQDVARLVIPGEHKPQGRYASLSHCWGKGKTLKLLQSNLEQLRTTGVDIAALPTSYREAITVCRRFGFRYIWIDSLCIIQDSREDWQREAMTMKDVYENSVLNIAAAAAAESSDPSFQERDPAFIQAVQVTAEWDDETAAQQGQCSHYYLVDDELHRKDLGESPLHQRAWVMQEVFLTTRNLSLTKSQMWFECSESNACETYPQGIPDRLLAENLDRTRPSCPPLDAAAAAAAVIYRRWWHVMEMYAACLLTFPGDKMIALAGIAQHFQGLLPGDTYLAGMWRSQLPSTLNWSARKLRPSFRPDGYRAPSWSWASIEGPVTFEHEPALADEGTVSTPCVLVDVAVHTVDQNETGSLRGGYIRLRAPITEVGIMDGSLALDTIPGSWHHIAGTDEADGDRTRGQCWTIADFDECTLDGTRAVSYLTPLTEQVCLAGQMESLTRVRETLVEGVREGYRLFTLPLVTFVYAGKRVSRGSVLLRREEWPRNVYQRAGEFTAVGDLAVDALEGRSSEELITIV